MTKYHLFGALTVAGILFTLFGTWGRITHQANNHNVLLTGFLLLAIGLSAITWFLYMWLRKKDQ